MAKTTSKASKTEQVRADFMKKTINPAQTLAALVAFGWTRTEANKMLNTWLKERMKQ